MYPYSLLAGHKMRKVINNFFIKIPRISLDAKSVIIIILCIWISCVYLISANIINKTHSYRTIKTELNHLQKSIQRAQKLQNTNNFIQQAFRNTDSSFVENVIEAKLKEGAGKTKTNLAFSESPATILPHYTETIYNLMHPTTLNANQLHKTLLLIEAPPSFPLCKNKPHLIIKELNVKRVSQNKDDDLWSINLAMIKREYNETTPN